MENRGEQTIGTVGLRIRDSGHKLGTRQRVGTGLTPAYNICMEVRPDVTVAAVCRQHGRFLIVEEQVTSGALVFNQPAGHLETGESLVEACVRETLEETGWHFAPRGIVGIYQWQHPYKQRYFVRVAFAGDCLRHDPDLPLDEGIVRVLWMTPQELDEHSDLLRSPMVLKCIEDFLSGACYPLDIVQYVDGTTHVDNSAARL